MEAIVILIGLVALAVTAWWWGVESIEGVDDPEWERRRTWRGFHRAG